MAVTIDDDLKTKIEALLAQVQTDIAVQEQLLTGPDDVTIVLPNGHSYTGPSWPKIANIAANTDYDQVLGPLGLEIKANADRAETARDAAELHEQDAQGVLTSVTALQTGYEAARDEAVASAATATAAATTATAASGSATASAKTASDAADTSKLATTATATAAANAKAAATDAEKYRDEAEGFRDEAEGFRDEAEQFALDAGNSASAAAKSNTSAQTAASTAQTLVVNANQASDSALQYSNDAKAALTAAQQQAQRAKNEADRIGTVSSVDDYLLYDQAAGTVDFKIVPTFNQQTISQIVSASGAAQINTAEICLSSPPAGADMDSAAWAGKTFMVEKPTVSGGVSSNGAPAAMDYDTAICTDSFATWTPSGGTKGNQRVQTIYDKNHLWLRGYHVELGTWTTWKRIAIQFDTDLTGKDLNLQLISGSFTYTSAINAPVIDASEASTIYFLDILSTDEGQDVTQTMRSPQTNSRFDRYRIAGVWSKWYNTTATMDVDTAPDGVDLNTLTNPGWFGVKLPSAVNLPTRGNGNPKVGQAILQVIGISNGGDIQHLSYLDTGEVWTRFKPADASGVAQPWKAWEPHFASGAVSVARGGTGAANAADARKNLALDRVIQDSTGTAIVNNNKTFSLAVKEAGTWGTWDETNKVWKPLAIEQGGTGAVTVAAARKSLGMFPVQAIGGSAATPVDINTINGNAPGVYWVGMTSLATLAAHYPIVEAGTLVVLPNGANGAEGCTQLYYPFTKNTHYLRRYDASAKTWSTWVSLTCDGEVAPAPLISQGSTTKNPYAQIHARYVNDTDTATYIGVMKPDGSLGGTADRGAIRMGGNRATGSVQIDAAYQGNLVWNGTKVKNPTTKDSGGKDVTLNVQSAWTAAIEDAGTGKPASTASIVFQRDHIISYNAAAGGYHNFNGSISCSSVNSTGGGTFAGQLKSNNGLVLGSDWVWSTWVTTDTKGVKTNHAGYRNAKSANLSHIIMYADGSSAAGLYIKTTDRTKTGGYDVTLTASGSNMVMGCSNFMTNGNLYWGITGGRDAATPTNRAYADSSGNTFGTAFGSTATARVACTTWAAGRFQPKTSDRRTKHDIKAITTDEAVEYIKATNPVSFRRNGSNVFDTGLIAQDVQKINPDLVEVVARLDDGEGDFIDNGYALGSSSGYMLKTLQHLLDKIDKLEARLADLEKAA